MAATRDRNWRAQAERCVLANFSRRDETRRPLGETSATLHPLHEFYERPSVLIFGRHATPVAFSHRTNTEPNEHVPLQLCCAGFSRFFISQCTIRLSRARVNRADIIYFSFFPRFDTTRSDFIWTALERGCWALERYR